LRDTAAVVAVGLRLYPAGSAGSPAWARSFAEAEQKLERGAIAWEWFAIDVNPTFEHEAISIQQRGYEPDMSSWRPICQSDGQAAKSQRERLGSQGALRGVVNDAGDSGAQRAASR
jgi:hypothetical protein